MWQSVLVLAVVGLGIQRIYEVLNEFFSPVVPGKLGKMDLTGSRALLWIVAAIFGYVAVNVVHYDPLNATGIGSGAAQVWNVLFIIVVADAMDSLWKGRIIRR